MMIDNIQSIKNTSTMAAAFDNDECFSDPARPIIFPFFIAFLFGIPGAAIWFFVATKLGLLLGLITLLVGWLCGLGVRKVRGDGMAAVMATFLHIAIMLTILTVMDVSAASGTSCLETLVNIVFHDAWTDFTNTCVEIAGRTFIGYPLAMFVSYRIATRD